MIDKQGIARIMDFGIARSLKAKSLTGTGVMIGTPEYMAPEQVDGKEVDLRSDIYSLGIILYEMLTGRLPFEADNPFTVGIKQKSEKPPDPKNYNGNIPEDLNRLILKCLEKKPENRYQSAGDLHADLGLLEQGVPTAERKISERKPLTSKEITVTIGLRKLVIPVFILVVLIATVVILLKVLPRGDSIPPLEGKPSVAILYFKNNTGDDGLKHWREALADLLIADLAQSKYVQVLSMDKLFNILGELDQLDANNFSSEVLREVASRGQVNHVLVGSFSRAGDVFRMNITLQKAAEGEVVGSESVEGTGEQSFYTMVDELTLRIKSHFALSQEQLSSDIDRDVGEITTAYPQALKFYIQARQLHLKQEYRQSINTMEKAVAIDPNFAMAYRSIAMSYNNLLLYTERTQYIQKAMELSDRLPDRERYQIIGDYYSDSESTYDKAIEAFTNLLELYPDTLNAINNLALRYSAIGETKKAIEYLEEAIQRGDRSSVVYTNLADAYQAIGEYDRSRDLLEGYIKTVEDLPTVRTALCTNYIEQGYLDSALAEAEKAFLLDPAEVSSLIRMGEIYRYKEEYPKAAAEFMKAMQQDEFRYQLGGRVWLMYLYIELGKFEEGLDLMNQGFEMVTRARQGAWITRYHIGFSRFYYGTGQPQKALEEAEKAWLSADSMKHYQYKRLALHLKGLAQLELNDIPAAENTAAALKEFIETGMNKRIIHLYYHLKGEIELEKSNFSQAVDFFQQALSLLEYGPLTTDVIYLNSLAQAYYQSKNLDKARLEFEKITSLTTGRQEQGYFYVKSFYMLGKINEELGHTAKAVEFYERFLTLWKDADPGIPEVESAKARLQKKG